MTPFRGSAAQFVCAPWFLVGCAGSTRPVRFQFFASVEFGICGFREHLHLHLLMAIGNGVARSNPGHPSFDQGSNNGNENTAVRKRATDTNARPLSIPVFDAPKK